MSGAEPAPTAEKRPILKRCSATKRSLADPEQLNLPALREAAAECKACDLYMLRDRTESRP